MLTRSLLEVPKRAARCPLCRGDAAGSKMFSMSATQLSGHSKWDNIKHKKAANDAQKAANAFKMSSKITVLAKMGGTDLSRNLQLVYAIEKAKTMNIPKKVIEKAIKRGSGDLKSDAKVETVVYEGMGPGGTAVIVEAITDNKNRSIGFVRPCFNKFELNMAPTMFMFDKKGLILIELGEATFDDAFEELLDLGVEDIEEIDDGLLELITDPKELGKVVDALKDTGKYKIKEMELGYVPKEDMKVEITDPDTKESYDKFIKSLEDLDDVNAVYSNLA